LNSGPSSIEGFDGSVLAELCVTKLATNVYISDYMANIISVRNRSVNLKNFIHHIIKNCSCKSDVDTNCIVKELIQQNLSISIIHKISLQSYETTMEKYK
jgi:hypothetical protein